MLDFHKAKPIKRLGAYVIDLILLLVITTAVALAMYSAMDYNAYEDKYEMSCEKYGQQFGVDLSASRADQAELSEAEQEKYLAAWEALNADEETMDALKQMLRIELLSLMVGFLVGYVILEIMIPLIFKNGQTVGKKILGLCVMHKYHVRVGFMQIIYRTILGKYFIETLIPVVMLVLSDYGVLGMTASLVLAAIAMTQGFIVMMSQANCGIHDKLFNTVVADFKKQHIFDTWNDRFDFEEAYEKEMAEREAAYGG
ncbi:MAG: RDD family protein [Oscillospiraceae bacterium]|nr:RDD family protein [Oscillospiraceae bacterium]